MKNYFKGTRQDYLRLLTINTTLCEKKIEVYKVSFAQVYVVKYKKL